MRYYIFTFFLLLGLAKSGFSQESISFSSLQSKATQQNFRTVYDWNQPATDAVEDIRKLDLLLFFLTNEYRIKNKKKPLDYHETLEYGAYLHSQQMASLNFFDHENKKNKALKLPEDRAKAGGILNPYPAENIAMFQNELLVSYLQIGEKLIDIWHHSPPHRSNMLAKDALQLGCGAAFANGNWYGTQLFQWFLPISSTGGELEFK